MSESEGNDNSNEAETTIDFNELSESQKEVLGTHPEVRKMLRYEETSIPQVAGMLRNLTEADEGSESAEAYELLVSGIAERSGRVTEATVRKVLSNLPEEYDEANPDNGD